MKKDSNMRKVIGMGETILDILFKNRQPVAAVPGGSSFNAIISTGRVGVPCHFIGSTGADEVGQMIVDFMHANGVSTQYFEQTEEKSAVSLAFLDEAGDAHYSFYKPSVKCPGEKSHPAFAPDDVLLFGSYYACCQPMHPFVEAVMDEAVRSGAILYYDLNFRRGHAHELPVLLPVIEQNMKQSTIVRGSADDFEVMYGMRNAEEIYRNHVSQHCQLFICTSGAEDITVCTPGGIYKYPVTPIHDVVSTVGAGDNFNAGMACAMIWQGVLREQLPTLGKDGWLRLLDTATAFSSAACRSTENYVPTDFRL